MVLLKICCHYSNVPINRVHIAKFIANIRENANVRCVSLQMAFAIIEIQLHLKSGTWFCHKIGDFSNIVLKECMKTSK